MKNSESKIVRIVEQNNQTGLSKSQKLFNKLIKKNEEERKLLRAWQTTIPLYQKKYASEFEPQMQAFNVLRTELVHLFDQASADKIFGKNDKEKLQDIICTISAELIIDNDNDELKQIYNKHSKGDFDAESEEQGNAIKSAMEELLGVKLGDEFDLRSPEKMMEHMDEKMREKFEQQEQIEQGRRERQSKRKKSAKTIAKEAKQQEETQNIRQSIQEVYRKLARALHPDREQDPVERDRKTALMQRVNVAYHAKDLLQLLELQLEVEQIDQATINSMTGERLKYYNKILKTQYVELQHEVSAVSISFALRFNIDPEVLSSPIGVLRDLESEIKKIQQQTTLLRKDLDSFKEDVKNIKNYLKSYPDPVSALFEEMGFCKL